MDLLVVLIIIFGIIAIVMFVLFVISYKRSVENRNENEENEVANEDVIGEEYTSPQEIEEKNDEMVEEVEELIAEPKESVDDSLKFDDDFEIGMNYFNSNENDISSSTKANDSEIEIISILIDNDLCVFDANNHVLKNGEYVRVFHNNYYDDGVVMQENTVVPISSLDFAPEKLLLENDNLEGISPNFEETDNEEILEKFEENKEETSDEEVAEEENDLPSETEEESDEDIESKETNEETLDDEVTEEENDLSSETEEDNEESDEDFESKETSEETSDDEVTEEENDLPSETEDDDEESSGDDSNDSDDSNESNSVPSENNANDLKEKKEENLAKTFQFKKISISFDNIDENVDFGTSNGENEFDNDLNLGNTIKKVTEEENSETEEKGNLSIPSEESPKEKESSKIDEGSSKTDVSMSDDEMFVPIKKKED